MKKLKTDHKLVLNTETLKNLTSEETDKVVGGAGGAAELTKDRTQYLCTCTCPFPTGPRAE
jgi:hypothetical protein